MRWQFMNDGSLRNISAWVSKKVPELVGMEEPDLVEFIMSHVRSHAAAGECWARQAQRGHACARLLVECVRARTCKS